MRTFKACAASAFLLALLARGACAASIRDASRTAFTRGDYSVAFDSFAVAARNSGDAGLVAEYAYSAAMTGWTELALAQLDRALILDPNDEEARFVLSKVFASLGLKDAADELARPAPSWLGVASPAPAALEHERDLPAFKEALASANVLMTQKRYASAADRFFRITRKWPEQALGWSGLAISLENLGAYKAAAKAAAQSAALRAKAGQAEAQQKALSYEKDLESRPPWAPQAPRSVSDALQGKYLAYFGGNLMHENSDTLFNLSTRLGKFITNRFDVAGEAGISTGNGSAGYNGVTVGVSGRYNHPLPWNFPLNATAAAKVEVAPGPGSDFAFILSPGLSHFMDSGSIDFFIDFNLTGPLSGSQAFSIGYTTYFGGPAK